PLQREFPYLTGASVKNGRDAIRTGRAGRPHRNGHVVNPIKVDPETSSWAKVALERMLTLPGG
ncbi:MAG: hypothetical protein U0904_08675, partial [Candidatus Nanopelagicales bacterium]|nr:hypothetical protein [Candidatus Nanopelagicales bacterium]